MYFLELAKKRYSVRKFSDKNVDKQIMDQILEAGRVAPTAVDYQPQRILVFDTPDSLKLIKKATKYHFDAPVILLVGYDNKVSWKRPYDNYDMGVVDASIVTTHMMLAATDLGLGTTWVGHFDPYLLKDTIKLPEDFVPVALLPLGYPAAEAVPHQLHYKRYDIDHTVTFYKP